MVIVRFARAWRAVLRMGHSLIRWSLQMMTQDGGTTAQLQGDHERCRGSTTKLSGMWGTGLRSEDWTGSRMLLFGRTAQRAGLEAVFSVTAGLGPHTRFPQVP